MLNSDKTLLNAAFALIRRMLENTDRLNMARKDMLKLSTDENKRELTGANFHVYGHTYRLEPNEALEFVNQQVAKLSRNLEMDRLQLARVLKEITDEPDEV